MTKTSTHIEAYTESAGHWLKARTAAEYDGMPLGAGQLKWSRLSRYAAVTGMMRYCTCMCSINQSGTTDHRL